MKLIAAIVCVAVAASMAAAQEMCRCSKMADTTCDSVIPTGPDTCVTTPVPCDKCYCDMDPDAELMCEMVTREAFLPTGDGDMCAFREINVVICPPADMPTATPMPPMPTPTEEPPTELLWRVGTGSCNDVCGRDGLTCNEAQTQVLNALGASDIAAFGVGMAIATGETCAATAFCNPGGACPFSGPVLIPSVGGFQCGYDLINPPTCEATIVFPPTASRTCCCGPAEFCPTTMP
mmetsp:Transcript_4773/g.10194  ORF Transcript_4773/g.10194 Transcript_4773/m.10194 type:complete len:235 (-) Transcript_4773:595-1299(-)